MTDVSNQNTTPVIREIPLESILPNPDNFYQLLDLDALADSIALSGLQQPLVVTPCPDKPGKFTLGPPATVGGLPLRSWSRTRQAPGRICGSFPALSRPTAHPPWQSCS